MTTIARRDLLKAAAQLAAMWGLGGAMIPRVAQAIEALATGEQPVLWLQAQSCSGCSVSLLNSDHPDVFDLLLQKIALRFNGTLCTATGAVAVDVIERTITEGGYWLVVEGALPVGMPEACVLAQQPMTTWVARAATNAKAIVALGTCSAFGGIPAAENNPTGAVNLGTFLKQQNIDKPLIKIPGCPAHPDWLVGTLVHLTKFGIPKLDEQLRPTAFFSRVLHDRCPRFADYERENFAKAFGDDGCLFLLGCLGPTTRADCNLRLWNGGTSACILAGAPCVGCASPNFAAKANFAFYPREALAAAAARKKEETRL
jgi:hydrogenase small subunit